MTEPSASPSRRVSYSEEIAERICDLLASGMSMRKICRSDDMPDRRTVERWMEADATFAARCARAREIGFDENADQMREEIDEEPDVSRAKLIFDYGKWRLSKLAPKKYGDRLELGGDAGSPIAISVVERVIVKTPNPDT